MLSAGNRDLPRVIAGKAPASLDELAHLTGRTKSNLSRTLRTLADCGLIRPERCERGRIAPRPARNRVEMPLTTEPERC